MAEHQQWSVRVLNRAAEIITPTAYLQSAVRNHGLDAQIIPNIIDLSEYQFRNRRNVRLRLFWMRSFHSIYNPMMAIEVLAQLRRQSLDATLVMAGRDKGLLQNVRRELKCRGLESAVRFVGYLDSEGKRREGSDADIFINTSHIDNAPVALIEAGAMGLPIVSTDVGGIRELFGHGRGAILIPDGDSEAMADALCRLWSEPELAERLSRNGRLVAEQCSWSRVGPKWHDSISRAIGR